MVKKQNKTIDLVLMAVAGVLLIALVLMVAVSAKYVYVKGSLYPKALMTMDLRQEQLTARDYDRLEQKLPEHRILWNVPFQNGHYSSDITELSLSTLSQEDVEVLDYFTQLKTVDARQCTDYPQLLELQSRRPECRVLYQVSISGKEYPQDATAVTAPGLDSQEAALLEYLPQLTEVDASGCHDYPLLQTLAQEHPNWAVTYTVLLAGEEYPYQSQEITVGAVTADELAVGLPAFDGLESLLLQDPDMDGESLMQLRQTYPEMQIHWEASFHGQSFPDDSTEIDISYAPIESTQEAERFAAYFPELTKLIVDSGEIDNDTMAAFREDQRPNYKVVWTVICGTGKFGSFPVRTDETTFMPLKHRIYWFQDDDMYNVRYCEDMVCIDVGHMVFKDLSFVQYMPHLKYLVLTLTDIRDISPLSSCKELVFLELGHCSGIRDLSPLIGCTALEDLNLGQTYADPEPLKQMPWLKNLWWVYRSVSVREELKDYLPNTHMVFDPEEKNTTGLGWRKLPNYYAMRDLLEMPYME